jgi:hypothetical protein
MPWREQARSGPPRGCSPSPPAPPSLARFASERRWLRGMALEIHAGNEGVKPEEAV